MAVTRQDQIERWQVQDLPEAAQEALLRLGTRERRESRILEVTRTLRELPRDYQIGLLLSELLGLGGEGPWGDGSGTARLPIFRECGKGRRLASDGPAWTDAIEHVFRKQLFPRSDPFQKITITITTDEYQQVIVNGTPVPESLLSARRQAVLAGEAMLSVMGYSAPRQSRLLGLGVRVEGDLSAWAATYADLARDAEIERDLRSVDWADEEAVEALGRRCQKAGSTYTAPREAAEQWHKGLVE